MESKGWSNRLSHVKNSRSAGRPVTLWLVSVCNYIIWSSHQLGPGCSQHPTSKCQLMNAVSLNTCLCNSTHWQWSGSQTLCPDAIQESFPECNNKLSNEVGNNFIFYDWVYSWSGLSVGPSGPFLPYSLPGAVIMQFYPREETETSSSMKLLPLWMMIKTIAFLIFLFFGESLWLFNLWNAWNLPWELLHFCLRLVTLMEAAY